MLNIQVELRLAQDHTSQLIDLRWKREKMQCAPSLHCYIQQPVKGLIDLNYAAHSQ